MKALDVRSLSLDELAFNYAQTQTTISGYEALGVDVPETLRGMLKDIKREVDERVRADREKMLISKRARRAALATPDEKRAKLDAEIAELEKLV